MAIVGTDLARIIALELLVKNLLKQKLDQRFESDSLEGILADFKLSLCSLCLSNRDPEIGEEALCGVVSEFLNRLAGQEDSEVLTSVATLEKELPPDRYRNWE